MRPHLHAPRVRTVASQGSEFHRLGFQDLGLFMQSLEISATHEQRYIAPVAVSSRIFRKH